MPGLTPIFDEAHDEGTAGGSLKLFLPSELSAEDRDAWCPPNIPALEFRFRYAQADDSLVEIRRILQFIRNLLDQNDKHLSKAQRTQTRSQGVLDGFRLRLRRCAGRYSHARDAMLALDPDQKLSPGWAQRFKKLNQGDLRGPGMGIEDRSNGRFILTWIWLVPRSDHPSSDSGTTTSTSGSTTANDEFTDYMRVHWAKCQARAERYEEEVELTIEEMGRTLCYFEWKQSQWLSVQSERENSDSPPPPDVQRGLRAYAHRQANIYGTLVVSFANRWRKSLLSLGFSPPWLSRYPVAPDPFSSQPSRGHFRSGSKPVVMAVDPESAHSGHKHPSPSPSGHTHPLPSPSPPPPVEDTDARLMGSPALDGDDYDYDSDDYDYDDNDYDYDGGHGDNDGGDNDGGSDDEYSVDEAEAFDLED